MSQPRFAPITASLLARKGNAAPSSMADFMPRTDLPPPPPRPAEKIEMPLFAETSPHRDHDPHQKKLFVSLSHPEHERLAIAAVKTGLTRHQLIRDALDLYFEQLSHDLPNECRCVSGATCMRSC